MTAWVEMETTQYKTGIIAHETLVTLRQLSSCDVNVNVNVTSGGVITMEDKNGRSALSQGNTTAPTKVKATLASIPVATKSLVNRGISSMSLCTLCLLCAVDCLLLFHIEVQ